MVCFLRKNRDLSIENSLRLIECTLAPLLAFSGPVIIWPEKEFKRLTVMNFAFEIRRESNPRSYLTRSSTLTTRPTVYIRLEPKVPIT